MATLAKDAQLAKLLFINVYYVAPLLVAICEHSIKERESLESRQ